MTFDSHHSETQPAAPQSAVANMTPYSVTLSVRHIDRAAEWYERVLRLRRVAEKRYPEYGTRLVFMQNPASHFRIELIEDARAKAGPARPDPPEHTAVLGVSQFAFEVLDLDAAHAELAAKDATFVWETKHYSDLSMRFFFIRDPEGTLLQFIQRLND